jgi:adenosine deaminase
MCGVSLTDEYWLAHQELGSTRREIDQMIQNAFANAFLPLPERQALLAEVTAELESLS